MMRSLWTAASGMTTQQTAVDVIANNLANVNTTGYKTQTAQFKTLLYQMSQEKTTSANGETRPVGAQVGLGVRNSAITTVFRQGGMVATENPSDFGINGDGFFTVMTGNDEIAYTRDGSFHWSPMSDGTTMLCTADGYGVLDSFGSRIVLEEGQNVANVRIDAQGNFSYPNEEGQLELMGIQMGLVQFNNPAGLTRGEGSVYYETEASGYAVYESELENEQRSTVRQNYVEASNVNVADEMVNLIVSQRAYEMNSKAITASDEMLQQANQLKR